MFGQTLRPATDLSLTESMAGPSMRTEVSAWNREVNTVPNTIVVLLADGVQEIDDAGELPCQFRCRLYEAIEAASMPEHENAGRFRRGRMELGCAYKVLPMLSLAKQEHESARSALMMAQRAYRGELELTLLVEVAEELGRIIDDAQFEDRID